MPIQPENRHRYPKDLAIREYPMVYRWKNNTRRAELYGRRCHIVARGRMGTVQVRFENGETVFTSWRALRADPA